MLLSSCWVFSLCARMVIMLWWWIIFCFFAFMMGASIKIWHAHFLAQPPFSFPLGLWLLCSCCVLPGSKQRAFGLGLTHVSWFLQLIIYRAGEWKWKDHRWYTYALWIDQEQKPFRRTIVLHVEMVSHVCFGRTQGSIAPNYLSDHVLHSRVVQRIYTWDKIEQHVWSLLLAA